MDNHKATFKPLDKLSLIRDIYRSLLITGRSYAAYNEEDVMPIVERLANRKEIFDPMSGYGLLMTYCSRIGIRSYGIEINPPQYYWQVLNNPGNSIDLIMVVEKIISAKKEWPKLSKKRLCAAASDDWFTSDAKEIITAFYKHIFKTVSSRSLSSKKTEELSVSIILPFVGRLSCIVPGNNTTRLKKGGICLYKDWEQDCLQYLYTLLNKLRTSAQVSKSLNHIIRMDDCRTIALPQNRFSSMITSPPYPNRVDYSIMFAPENDFIAHLIEENKISMKLPSNYMIGTNVVSGRLLQKVRSKSANKFLSSIEQFKGTKKAESANRGYYLPYYANYFSDLERAYENIVLSLKKDFEGYIIVVENTARSSFIPVATSIIETWRYLGFKAEIEKKKEEFHVGTQNPRARGFKAKHTEYTIKVWRR
jgi:hypothetical protein